MTTEALAIVAAIAIPLLTLVVIVRLSRRVGDLERSRDELTDLRTQGRQ